MSVAAVFPGQGSQFAGMADPWLEHPVGRDVLGEASGVLGRDVVAGCRDEGALSTTEFVQPAMLACDVAAFRVLEALGVGFSGVAGHSLGEFAALVAAGVLELGEAVRIVTVRGQAMQRAGEERPGTMSALLGAGFDRAIEICDAARGDDVLVVANENSPQQVVISGSIAAVERAEAIAAEDKVRAVRLNVAGAFHSALMEPALAELAEAIDAARFANPRVPVASNVTGVLERDGEELRALSKRHVVSPVRWERCVRALAETGATTFVEAGPGDVLTKLAKRAAPGYRAVAIGSPQAAAAFAEGRG